MTTQTGQRFVISSVLFVATSLPLIWSRNRAAHLIFIRATLIVSGYSYGYWTISGASALGSP